MKDVNICETGFVYGFWKTDFGAWQINNRNNALYLLVGEKKALLIDTGYGDGDLREIVEKITDLPVMVVDTHGHLDHSGGNAFFEEVWMGKGGEEDALALEVRHQLPYPDYKINNLEDGQLIDLGGRVIEAIAIGAHHRSSFAFLDKENRTLYSGDELESAQVLLFVHGEEVDDIEIAKRHIVNMKKLKARSAEFDRIAPAHNGGPLDPSYIDDYIELADRLIAGTIEPEPTCAGFGWPVGLFGGDDILARYTHKKASFIVRKI